MALCFVGLQVYGIYMYCAVLPHDGDISTIGADLPGAVGANAPKGKIAKITIRKNAYIVVIGAGTVLKVRGHPLSGAKRRKNFFTVPPHFYVVPP